MSQIVITGKIKKIRKLDNDFNIIFFNSKDADEKYKTNFGTFVVQGTGVFSENETIKFVGNWEFNKKYSNWAFKFTDFERKKPEKKEEIIAYLQSHIFKGIGPILAQRIVDKFKEETIEIIESNPERLKEVEGIGLRKYEKLMSTYNSGEAYKQLTKLLVGPPISLSQSVISRIYKELGKTAVAQMEENPYVLCEKVSRIGFRTADFIAREKFNIQINDMSRIRAGILYVLNQFSLANGHTYLPISVLYNEFRKIIPELNIQDFNMAIKLMNKVDLKVIVDNNNKSNSPVMLKKYFNMENTICNAILDLKNTKSKRIKNIDNLIEDIQSEIGIRYADSQIEAIRSIDKTNFLVITGGPGTGKSTVLNGILKVFKRHNPIMDIVLAAPTGRAAKRMEETTGRSASTIHRILEFKPGEGFTRNAENPLEADVVIIDESSMIDISLMSNLLKAVKARTKVIVVGDVDQLPSVGPGTVLKDLIDSNVVPVVRLSKVFRQGQDSLININSYKINNAEYDLVFSEEEFCFVEEFIPANLQDAIVANFVDELLKEKERTGSITEALYNVQILTPTRIGLAGTVVLNNKIQEAINHNIGNEVSSTFKDKEGEEITIRFRIGDKVMQTQNDYNKDVYNGDLGIIVSIEKEKDDFEINVEFEDGRIVSYTKDELKGELIHAYATTIHKSQGSEYRVVIMVVSSSQNFMNQKNLFYTGVTRAKQKIIICGDASAIKFSIGKVDANVRYTILKKLLTEKSIA